MLTAPTPPPPLTHAAATARSLARTPLARYCHCSLAHRRHRCLPDRISHARACTPALALARTRLPALARCCLHSRHHRHRTLNRHPAPRHTNLHLAAPICTPHARLCTWHARRPSCSGVEYQAMRGQGPTRGERGHGMAEVCQNFR